MTRRLASLAASFAAAFVLLGAPASSRASSFSNVIVYGDSLSDNGNLYKATGYPPAPYYDGRFSNGPVAVEQLATSLGAQLTDFAYGGATSGLGNIIDGGNQSKLGAFGLPGLLAQYGATKGAIPTTLPSALFVVWGGANDFESTPQGDPVQAAKNIATIAGALELSGAQHILVPGLPDLSLTPEFFGDSSARQYTNTFNATLQTLLGQTNAVYFDTYSVLNSIEADPAAYGFTDTTTPCVTSTSLCSDPAQHLFWDDIHPTTQADAILAQDFSNAVAPTPEPSSLLLLGTGMTGVGALLRRRKSA